MGEQELYVILEHAKVVRGRRQMVDLAAKLQGGLPKYEKADVGRLLETEAPAMGSAFWVGDIRVLRVEEV